jgi:hypothetical protein
LRFICIVLLLFTLKRANSESDQRRVITRFVLRFIQRRES